MTREFSKFFRIGVAGITVDGRDIKDKDIQDMAATFDPRIYGCRINIEHLRGILPCSVFGRYGDVAELKAEQINDDSALNGKWALYARLDPLQELIDLVSKGQKVYTSMEIQRNFANTGKSYLVGLALTDDPASLGTEYLKFCRNAEHNPLNRLATDAEILVSTYTLAELEGGLQSEPLLTSLSDKVKTIFNRKTGNEEARYRDMHQAIITASEYIQSQVNQTGQQQATLSAAFNQLKQDVCVQTEQLQQAFTALLNSVNNTASPTPPCRSKATGGERQADLTDC